MPRVIDAFAQFFDDNGDPLVNGFLAFKESGTNNTDKDTFADINEKIANTNPLQLDGAGRCPNVFGTGTYNAISYAEDANNPGNPGQQIQQFDPVNIAAIEGQFSDWNSATSYNLGDLVIASDGNYYRSLTNNNENQDPTTSAGQWEEIKFVGVWNINVTYDSGDSVYGSDGILYLSLVGSNIANNPTTDIVNWKSYMDNSSPDVLDNIGFTAAVATKALTFDLKTRNLIDPNATDKVSIAFRSETLTTGDYDVVEAGAALTVVVPDGATLGFTAAETDFVYLYAVNNAGAIELGVTGTALDSSVLDDSILHSTVAIDATADSKSVLYTTVARTGVPIRLIGRIKIETGAVEGEWDNAPTELYAGEPTPIIAPTAAQGASLVLISAATASTSASIEFTTGIDATYDEYVISLVNVLPATNATGLNVRVSEDGGSTYKAGAADYSGISLINDSAGGAANKTGNDVYIPIGITGDHENAATGGFSGIIRMFRPSSTTHHKYFRVDGLYRRTASSNLANAEESWMYYGTTNAIDAIRFTFTAGNIASGDIILYGVKDS